MHTIATVEVDCPAPDAFALLADFEQNPLWQGGMKACAWLTPPPVAVGSRYEQRAEFLGRPILSTFEVTALDPGRAISIASVAGTFPIQVTRTVEPLAEGRCRITADVRGQPPLWIRMLGPLTVWMLARSVRADYAALAALLRDQRSSAGNSSPGSTDRAR